MERKYYKSVDLLAQDIIEQVQNGIATSVVLFVEDTLELMKEFLKNDEVSLGSVSIVEPKSAYDYDREYITLIDDNLELYIEPAYVDGDYLLIDGDCVYVDMSANSAILSKVDERRCKELYLGAAITEYCDDD